MHVFVSGKDASMLVMLLTGFDKTLSYGYACLPLIMYFQLLVAMSMTSLRLTSFQATVDITGGKPVYFNELNYILTAQILIG